jgi:hypothetical protein
MQRLSERYTARYNFDEPGLPISPPPRRPGFSLACVPVLRDDFLMYISGRIVMCCT